MKTILTYFVAAFMLVWYSLSVIGFDVHTCNGSGETYIATLASGFSCDDIHPEHQESACGCCHSEERGNEVSCCDINPCCTDSYLMILLTGVKVDDEDYKVICGSDHTYSPVLNLSEKSFALSTKQPFCRPHLKVAEAMSIQRMYGVWRI